MPPVCRIEEHESFSKKEESDDGMSRGNLMRPTGLSRSRYPHDARSVDMKSDEDIVDMDDVITINVSGLKFQTRKSTLNRFPTTLLGSTDREKHYNSSTKEYFFDRHRESFETILYFYQSDGLLCLPATLNADIFMEEVRFFRLGEHILEKLSPDVSNTKQIVLPDHPMQKRVWQVFEDPQSGIFAKCVAYIDITMIMIAITSVCVETLPIFRHEDDSAELKARRIPHLDQKIFFGIEVVCIIWFTIELLARFACCPNKKQFWKSIINWIDLAAILPFYIGLMVPRDQQDLQSLVFIRMIRFTRIFRIFKMSRHFAGLLALAYALRAGSRELALLFLLLSICVVLFSSMVYFADLHQPGSQFSSIIEAFWWSIVTMSTVGYGDYVPVSTLGKIVGVFCALMGILVIALPFPIIVSRFNYYYELEKSGKSLEEGEFEEEYAKPMFMGVIYAFKRSKGDLQNNRISEEESPKVEEKFTHGYSAIPNSNDRNNDNHIASQL
ncbi:potassium voltage-gated channel subfamily A member 7-like isoform X3 [Bolinopsis microptera]|uniref:potassium voltage-gated channel subfamily A member 7-like isoform X3 n=2 Tax=Bolinopsis microptera TaxID=2820187 RepID=UPI00307963C2